MKNRILFFLVSSLFVNNLIAQQGLTDKTQHVFDSLNELCNKQWITDSLSVLAWGDSLRNRINNKATKQITSINNKIDSLSHLQIPPTGLQQKIDSINQRKDQLLSTVAGKQEQILTGTKAILTSWQSKVTFPSGNFNPDITRGVDIPLNNINLPSEKLKIPSLGAVDFQHVELPSDLVSLNQSLPFSNMAGLQEWKEKIGDVTDNFSSIKDLKTNPDKVLEAAVTNIAQVNEVQEVLNPSALDQSEYGTVLQSANDEEAMKKLLLDEAKKEAINHFAGKEQVLKAAMEQVSKYKKIYGNVSSLSELQTRPKNPLKDKPFRERFVSGLGIQIHVRNYLNVDLNPYVSYLLTPRFSAGIGWNQRWATEWRSKSIVFEGRVFGPRSFGEAKLKKGFAIRLEGEAMNTYVPPYIQAPGEGKRVWLYTAMAGVKKEYRFFKKIKGYSIVQFDISKLFVSNNPSPYGDITNFRMGFEFPYKKKVKKPDQQ
jgi:hypothetical protein